ncbi:hypothetical protein N7450_001013 [Penicillium hetheringtonii]|uniref:Uncharacterized protein n=1 Tax=Penicillium hetheringtonii TaxID=911720 RepID=A0AAD6E3C8_9EURO|nr:hypothetical protein N7450_001013 [Penicillium hetheringtonii]
MHPAALPVLSSQGIAIPTRGCVKAFSENQPPVISIYHENLSDVMGKQADPTEVKFIPSYVRERTISVSKP